MSDYRNYQKPGGRSKKRFRVFESPNSGLLNGRFVINGQRYSFWIFDLNDQDKKTHDRHVANIKIQHEGRAHQNQGKSYGGF